MISLLLALTIISSALVFPASAAAHKEVSGAIEANEEQMRELNAERKEGKENRSEKEALASAVTDVRGAAWIYTSRNFYYYSQEYSYSCGAACVRMALRNFTGTNYSEKTIRDGCNASNSAVFIGNMKKYINQMQNHNAYVPRVGVDKSTMQSNLYSGIVNWDSPSIIGVEENMRDGWYFDLPGHFITVYAARSDKEKFLIADPWAGYVNEPEKNWRNVSVTELYNAYSSTVIGYIF